MDGPTGNQHFEILIYEGRMATQLNDKTRGELKEKIIHLLKTNAWVRNSAQELASHFNTSISAIKYWKSRLSKVTIGTSQTTSGDGEVIKAKRAMRRMKQVADVFVFKHCPHCGGKLPSGVKFDE